MAEVLNIDSATYCKIERGERKAKREQLPIFAEYMKADKDELLTLWLAEQVYNVEKSRAQNDTIKAPVLFRLNNRIDKFFDADAVSVDGKIVLNSGNIVDECKGFVGRGF
jgi:transcriptional regulator with XRE-family HTH domain